MTAPILGEKCRVCGKHLPKKSRRLIFNQYFSVFEQLLKFWVTFLALLMADRSMFALGALINSTNCVRCKITPPNVIFGFDTFYGVIFMCTFCSKF